MVLQFVEIERYIVDKEVSMGYDHVYTPVLANVDLYKTSDIGITIKRICSPNEIR